MAVIMMIVSAIISIVFLVDFAKTILELQKDRATINASRRDRPGFQI